MPFGSKTFLIAFIISSVGLSTARARYYDFTQSKQGSMDVLTKN